MPNIEKYFIENSEIRTEALIKRQCVDEHSPVFGSIVYDEYSLPDPKATAWNTLTFATSWLYPKSRFWGDIRMFERIDIALDFITRRQHPGGCFDLENVNFYSAPDTAFILCALIPLYRLFQKHKYADKTALSPLAEKINNIMLPAFEGICAGGFHTPNHRWVNASTLAAGYNFTRNKAYLDKAKRYLAEGIDCNEYGEYSEKSANYNFVNNRAMIMLFEELGDEKYLEYVKRNLDMTLYYLESDGSLFTEKSVRQDRGRKYFPDELYFQYLYIAHHYKDKAAAQVAAFIFDRLFKNRYFAAPDFLYEFMLHEEISFSDTDLFVSADNFKIPDYNRHFSSSGIVRYKRGDFGYTLMENNNKILCFSVGNLIGYMKLTVGYFSAGHIQAAHIQPTDNGYCFDFGAESWYYEPLENVTEPIIDFRAADHSMRKLQHPSRISLRFEIRHAENGIDLRIVTNGLNGVHYRFEFVLPPGKLTTHDSFAMVPEPGSYVLLKNGHVNVHDKNHTLVIGECFADRQVFQVNGHSDPRSSDSYTVYMTGTTNFDRVIKIRVI